MIIKASSSFKKLYTISRTVIFVALIASILSDELLTAGGVAAVDSEPFDHHSSSSLSIDNVKFAGQQHGPSIHDNDKNPIINEPQKDDRNNKQKLSKSSSQALHLRGARSLNNSDGGSVHADQQAQSDVLLAKNHAGKQDGIISDSSMSMSTSRVTTVNAKFYDPVDDVDMTEKLFPTNVNNVDADIDHTDNDGEHTTSIERRITSSQVGQLLDDDCTLYAVGDTRLRGKHHSKTHSSNELDFVCEPNGLGAQGNSGTQGSYHINLTKAQKKFLQNGMNNGSVVSGLTTLQGAYYEDNEIVISENTTFGRKEEELKVLSKQKSILVVRVTDKDGKVIRDSAAQVGDNVFGTISDPVNLKSQMYDCSYGAVDITNEYNSPNIDDKLSAPGVLDVTIPISINGNRYTVHNAVTKAAEAKLGYKLPGQHEQVMYVLEKCYQTCGWAAYAYINSWLSVYQNKYYLQTGVQMHEIGHNFGMAHSGGLNGEAYTDHTCSMGNPLYSDDVGKMCFNPAKNWYLNWYDDYKTTVDITVPNISKKITMVGIAEIKVNNPNKMPAVLKLETGTTKDYFVGFNRATGINSQNDEADDEVTIVQTGNNGESYSQSYLKATLKQGESYSIGELKITATAIDIRKQPGTAIVTLVKGKQQREIFYIRNPATGKYLDVRGARCHNGNTLILYQFNGSVAQQFYFGPNGSIMNAGCNKPLDIKGRSCDNGTRLIIWDYHGGPNQKFEVRGREIWNRKCNKAIDNFAGRNANHNPIIIWNPHKRGPQQWEIVKKQKQGTYLIKSHHGTQIRIYSYNKVDMTVYALSWEKITIVPVGNGQYALKSAAHGNRYLRVPGKGSYRTIDTQTFVGGWEKFYIIHLQNGKVAFKSAQWGNYLRANKGNNVRLDTQTYIAGWEQFTLIAK